MTGLERSQRIACLAATMTVATSLFLAPPSTAQDRQAGATTPRAFVAGNCVTTASKFKVSVSAVSTISNIYKNIAESDITIVQGSLGCVIVAFSAEARADSEDTMYVRPLLDGEICQPNAVAFVTSDPDFNQMSAHGMNFVCPGVEPGRHRVRMQYLSIDGGEVFMARRTLLVHYVK